MNLILLFICSAIIYETKSNPINTKPEPEKDDLIYNPLKVPNDINLKLLLKHLDNFVPEINLNNEVTNLFGSSISNSVSMINQIKTQWLQFKKKFNKVYTCAKEETKRFLNFLRNYIHVKSHNIKFKAGAVQYNMSINHLSDLNDTEYSALLGFKLVKPSKGIKYLSPLLKIELPTNVDWRKTAVTAVKDQGNCGSCWAFSTTGSLEGQHYRKTRKLVSLSEQQLVDCSLKNDGCGGGLMDQAFTYIKKNKGIDTEMSYPYVSGTLGHREITCNFTINYIGATVSGFVDIETGHEDQLKEAVALIGPISVGIDASNLSFRNYHTGIYDEPSCDSVSLDHGVLVVGYGIDKHSKIPFWLVKNSWNVTWGDKGYIKMKRNANNMCGIATAASYPLV